MCTSRQVVIPRTKTHAIHSFSLVVWLVHVWSMDAATIGIAVRGKGDPRTCALPVGVAGPWRPAGERTKLVLVHVLHGVSSLFTRSPHVGVGR